MEKQLKLPKKIKMNKCQMSGWDNDSYWVTTHTKDGNMGAKLSRKIFGSNP
jgi:hypothetical protein